ncbi:MAG: hypothetical protein J0I12_02180 [Candidatus Eremiobacteraeota bacterium]|nr:hypothetical protein [Candidatus Eremiobacteraeota bacterium]
MLHYPKIPSSKHCRLGPCVVFDKLDGTNLHWDWDRDFGWHAFGTRRDSHNLLSEGIQGFERDHPNLRGAAELFERVLASPTAEILHDLPVRQAVLFTEFVGPGSFAGSHRAEEPKRLVLFDVSLDSQMLGPEEFLDRLGHLDIPRVLYRGKFKGQLLEEIYEGKYDVPEGVVIKGGSGEQLWMAKVKTRAYEQLLRKQFGGNWQDYWE